MLELRGAVALPTVPAESHKQTEMAKEEFAVRSAHSVGCFQWPPAHADPASVWCHLHWLDTKPQHLGQEQK